MFDLIVSIVTNIGSVILSIVVSAIVGIVVIIAIANYHAVRLMYGLPWLKWLSLEDVEKLGFSRFWSKVLLPVFFRKGYIEIRTAFPDEFSIDRKAAIEKEGFVADNVEYYNFKITKHGGRKKKHFITWMLPGWQPRVA